MNDRWFTFREYALKADRHERTDGEGEEWQIRTVVHGEKSRELLAWALVIGWLYMWGGVEVCRAGEEEFTL